MRSETRSRSNATRGRFTQSDLHPPKVVKKMHRAQKIRANRSFMRRFALIVRCCRGRRRGCGTYYPILSICIVLLVRGRALSYSSSSGFAHIASGARTSWPSVPSVRWGTWRICGERVGTSLGATPALASRRLVGIMNGREKGRACILGSICSSWASPRPSA